MLATKVTPGTLKTLSYVASSLAKTAWPSANPQLIDTTDTPGWLAAVATLAIRSDSDWLLASTRMIWAPGAMAWAHSTSSASSTSQLSVPGPLGSVAGQRGRLAVLVEDRQERRRRPVLVVERRSGGGQAELGVEGVEGLEDGRVVVGIDDGDGLAGAVERQVVDAVGGPDLGRGVGDRPGGRASSVTVLAIAVAADRQRIDDRSRSGLSTADLGVAALGELGRRRVDRAGHPRWRCR